MYNLSVPTIPELPNSSTSLPILAGNFSHNVSVPTMSKPDWIIVPSVFAFIFMVGVLGNGILILIVAVNRNMKTTPNVLLVSLATGDLLLIVISSPFTSVYYFYDEWPFGEVICKLNEFLFSLSLGVSVFTLTALSGERYMVIVFPMQSRRGANSMAKAVLMAVLIWILSALLASLDLYTAHVKYMPAGKKDIATCMPFPMDDMDSPISIWYSKFHTIFRFLVYFLIPIVIITTFYVCMAVILLRSSNNLPGEADIQTRTIKQVEARKNVARIVLTCVFIFIICWLPRHVYQFWYHFDPGQYNMFWHLFKIFGFCLCFMNSCVNPFALYFLSDQFRRYYNRYLFRKMCCCFAPLCRKSTMMTDATTDDDTVTSRRRSVLEMITLRTRGGTTNDKQKSTKASLTTATLGEGGADTLGRLKNKFAVYDGKRGSTDRKQNRRRSSNTANGRIFQKLLMNSKKEKKKSQREETEADSKVTAQCEMP